MILKNAKIFDENFDLVLKDISIENGKIAKIYKADDNDAYIDLKNHIVMPGFIDQHIHGCAGFDTCDATEEAINEISNYLVTKGVTSFCPTTMTLSEEKLNDILSCINKCKNKGTSGAYIHGVNMEGPFINKAKKGAQKEEYIQKPNFELLKKLNDKNNNLIKFIDIAPECLDENSNFIKEASKLMRVSLAHTNADYTQATRAFEEGVTQVTHLFNAMPGLTHRSPGVVGAVFDSKFAKAEIICDGLHIHPAVLRVAFNILGEDRTIIISDSMSAAGCKDGEYELGGQKVFVKNGLATLKDKTIAGSTTNLFDEFKNVINYGIPLKQAVKSLTINPAKQIGVDKLTGSIEKGKFADLTIVDEKFNLKMVLVKGKIAFAG